MGERVDVFLAVGHGVNADGVFDPGAVKKEGSKLVLEHDEALSVVEAAAKELRDRGFRVRTEVAAARKHRDPNFLGSTVRSKGIGARVAVEVHFDCSVCGRGGFGIYGAGKAGAQKLATAIRRAYLRNRLPVRTNYSHGFYFPLNAQPAAIIWECDAVGAKYDKKDFGQAIAEGIANYLRD